MDSNDAEYIDKAIDKVILDDKEIFNLMKSQIQVTQSAITNLNDRRII